MFFSIRSIAELKLFPKEVSLFVEFPKWRPANLPMMTIRIGKITMVTTPKRFNGFNQRSSSMGNDFERRVYRHLFCLED